MIKESILGHRLREMQAKLAKYNAAIAPKHTKIIGLSAPNHPHPNVGDIHRGVHRYHPPTSLATVYNTQEIHTKTRQVLELEFSESPNLYNGRRSDCHPHNFRVDCRRIKGINFKRPEFK